MREDDWMRMLNRRTWFAAALLVAAGSQAASTGRAAADSPAARSGDVVGVGSSALQNMTDFLFDGAPGVPSGYNFTGNVNRVYSVFATGDANGRPGPDNASVILRAGSKPVVRPNDSAAGIAALVQDTPGDAADFAGYQGLINGSIQFARAARLPTATEIGSCPTGGACGGLHVYRAATDQLAIAVSNNAAAAYDGPPGLSAAELVGIYTCATTRWNRLPGNSAGSTNQIHPLIPPPGSDTRTFFLADLQAANGGNPITLGSCVRTVEENDPTGIAADPLPADAIEPFSSGEITLLDGGYFATGAGPSGSAFAPHQLVLLSGAPGDSNAGYRSVRGLYFVIRQADLAITRPFQPGGTQNWARALFAGGNSWIGRSTSQALIAAAGLKPSYRDCGINPTTC